MSIQPHYDCYPVDEAGILAPMSHAARSVFITLRLQCWIMNGVPWDDEKRLRTIVRNACGVGLNAFGDFGRKWSIFFQFQSKIACTTIGTKASALRSWKRAPS